MALAYGTLDFIEGAVISAVILLNICLGFVSLLLTSTNSDSSQLLSGLRRREENEWPSSTCRTLSQRDAKWHC